jgi:hypothetical protein
MTKQRENPRYPRPASQQVNGIFSCLDVTTHHVGSCPGVGTLQPSKSSPSAGASNPLSSLLGREAGSPHQDMTKETEDVLTLNWKRKTTAEKRIGKAMKRVAKDAKRRDKTNYKLENSLEKLERTVVEHWEWFNGEDD